MRTSFNLFTASLVLMITLCASSLAAQMSGISKTGGNSADMARTAGLLRPTGKTEAKKSGPAKTGPADSAKKADASESKATLGRGDEMVMRRDTPSAEEKAEQSQAKPAKSGDGDGMIEEGEGFGPMQWTILGAAIFLAGALAGAFIFRKKS